MLIGSLASQKKEFYSLSKNRIGFITSAMAHVLKQYFKLNTMADDPNKRGAADRRRVSQQPHEQAYQKRKRKEEESGSSRSSSSGRNSPGGRSSGRKSSGSNE
jgi:FtsZ-interacting cell division protein YlmF